METISFKYTISTTDYTRDIDVIFYEQDYIEESEIYEDVDFTKGVEIYAEYKRWTMYFGLLTATDMDYLIQWKRHDYSPKFTISSTEYGPLIVDKIKITHEGGSLIAHARSPEA